MSPIRRCHTGADAVVAVERLARVIRRLTAKQAGFAERVDACRAQPRQAGSPDDWLARQNGTSVGDARRAIDTARRLKSSCPATADAFANGELSLGEADAISGAAAVDPAAEAELVAKAKRSHDLADTRERAAKVKAAARNESPAARKRRLRAKRRWSEFSDDEMKAVAARWLPEEFALGGTGDRRVRQADLRPGPPRRCPRPARGLSGRRRARRPRRRRRARRPRRHPENHPSHRDTRTSRRVQGPTATVSPAAGATDTTEARRRRRNDRHDRDVASLPGSPARPDRPRPRRLVPSSATRPRRRPPRPSRPSSEPERTRSWWRC